MAKVAEVHADLTLIMQLRTFEYFLIPLLQIFLHFKDLYHDGQSGSMTLCQSQLVKIICTSLGSCQGL